MKQNPYAKQTNQHTNQASWIVMNDECMIVQLKNV